MKSELPAVGHRYGAGFEAFRVEFDLTSSASSTYREFDEHGESVGSESVAIKVGQIAGGIFSVTRQEADQMIVAHAEDNLQPLLMVTHITGADFTFARSHATFWKLS